MNRFGKATGVNTFSRETKVGLFFLAVIAVGAYIWFHVLDSGVGNGFLLTAQFKGVEGLVPGAQVQMTGIRIGRVKDIRFDPTRNMALVLMKIRKEYQDIIPEDSQVRLMTKGFMGDKYVVIVPGRPHARKLKADEEIKTVFEVAPMDKTVQTMGMVGQDVQALSQEADRQKIREKGSRHIGSIGENARASFRDLTGILHNKSKIDSAVANTKSASDTLKQTASRNREKIKRTSDGLNNLSERMEKRSARSMTTESEWDLLSRDVRSGKGTFGKMATDQELQREAQNLKRRAQGLGDAIRKGQGGAARIINDPGLSQDARRMVRNMNKTMEDVSEATPLSTLAIILGAILR